MPNLLCSVPKRKVENAGGRETRTLCLQAAFGTSSRHCKRCSCMFFTFFNDVQCCTVPSRLIGSPTASGKWIFGFAFPSYVQAGGRETCTWHLQAACYTRSMSRKSYPCMFFKFSNGVQHRTVLESDAGSVTSGRKWIFDFSGWNFFQARGRETTGVRTPTRLMRIGKLARDVFEAFWYVYMVVQHSWGHQEPLLLLPAPKCKIGFKAETRKSSRLVIVSFFARLYRCSMHGKTFFSMFANFSNYFGARTVLSTTHVRQYCHVKAHCAGWSLGLPGNPRGWAFDHRTLDPVRVVGVGKAVKVSRRTIPIVCTVLPAVVLTREALVAVESEKFQFRNFGPVCLGTRGGQVFELKGACQLVCSAWKSFSGLFASYFSSFYSGTCRTSARRKGSVRCTRLCSLTWKISEGSVAGRNFFCFIYRKVPWFLHSQ